ncbi:MAG: hypothetical protein FWF90_04475 [Promicromonosporaceae bacterium]|nr:hypothetical protein [Promicromonosporaceae bacterium]
MSTPAPIKLVPAVASWVDRQETPGLGLTEALTGLTHDWVAGTPAQPEEHVQRLARLNELTDALRAATVQATLEAVEAGVASKEIAATLGTTGATVSKWVTQARGAA